MPPETAKLLMFSGATAILFSSLLGFGMRQPLQSKKPKTGRGVNFKQIGAAHLDWIMLGLMQGLAGALIWAFGLNPPLWAAVALIFGGWANPLPYVFRAFGVDAFVWGGDFVQRSAAALGLLSSLSIVAGWSVLLWTAWRAW